MSKKVKVDGISYYACVQNVNAVSGKYSISLVVDAKTSKELKALGLNPAKHQDGSPVSFEDHPGDVFKFNRNPSLGSPNIVDSLGTSVDVLVGNGSKVRVYGSAYDYKLQTGQSGVAGGFNTLQIIELVEFNPVDKIEGGYVAKDTHKATTKTETADSSEQAGTEEGFFESEEDAPF